MKQHPLCTDTEHAANVMDLAVPAELKQEWAALQTRRHFLGRSGKVLGWAAMASLLGDRSLRGDSYTSDAKGQPGAPLKLPHFAPKAKRAIYLSCPAVRRRSTCSITSQISPPSIQGHSRLSAWRPAVNRHDRRPGPLSYCASHWDFKRYGQTGTW